MFIFKCTMTSWYRQKEDHNVEVLNLDPSTKDDGFKPGLRGS